ncbi:glycosyl hydrolase family 2 [Neptunitalea chrysea]|uniref:Glycosyl hydrolase family 2 n=1 Tax=Neptunitalea chrysea TaxID=1647581 RepID=A0A9W6B5U8_9FLAO|nr:glycosyl hydrolase [Neptunitalea chrysea]GLB51253.1 glycosyl hydrolase family 2 [Neptunitalea chrysea]
MIKKNRGGFTIICSLLLLFSALGNAQQHSETVKPWARWWWMGNAVDSTGIKYNLIALQKAGIGGVEITPIYGVKGEESNYLKFLSKEYLQIVSYTLEVADSLDMRVDMTLGTGWPYGGSQVTTKDAATKLIVQTYTVNKGERFKDTITVMNPKEKKGASLSYVLAFDKNGKYQDITNQLEENHMINWKARKSDATIYAVFTGKTGQKVKRAAPGGEGYTLDHYSTKAFRHYVQPFDTAFSKLNGKLRAVFNDSYEVYGTDFTPDFFTEFEQRRGYDIKPFLPHLLDTTSTEIGNRIKSDYRETISDLLKDFDSTWTLWAHNHDLITRLQAHGSPGNLIDYYAAADIPECETFGSMPFDIKGLRRDAENIRQGDADLVMLKFSSSAAHISGKNLVSSETFTWLREHFKTALSQCKPEVEELFLNGINHTFLHGSTYSPERAKWPGWKFYASVNFNYNNTIWEDAPSLFSYIKNCQEFLQEGTAVRETLLYWPIYDIWQQPLKADLMVQFPIHSLKDWLYGTDFYDTATSLIERGYSTDFISDSFIQQAKVKNGKVMVPGGAYDCIIIPECTYMPLNTLEHLLNLKREGAHIIFKGIPEGVPGYLNYKQQNEEFLNLIKKMKIHTSEDLYNALDIIGIHNESLIATGLKYVSRIDKDGNKIYFLVNHTDHKIDTYLSLDIAGSVIQLIDPLTGRNGKAKVWSKDGHNKVRVSLPSGETVFVASTKEDISSWNYFDSVEDGLAYDLETSWLLDFVKGGPTLPSNATIDTLASWTILNAEAEAFSGTVSYTATFDKPAEGISWMLDLGDVRESAKVWINGRYLGCAWANPYKIYIGALKEKGNTIKIDVTNLPANRLRALEKSGEEWKIFHEINMVTKDYKKFDATVWQPTPSGLLGPVKLIPLKVEITK